MVKVLDENMKNNLNELNFSAETYFLSVCSCSELWDKRMYAWLASQCQTYQSTHQPKRKPVYDPATAHLVPPTERKTGKIYGDCDVAKYTSVVDVFLDIVL